VFAVAYPALDLYPVVHVPPLSLNVWLKIERAPEGEPALCHLSAIFVRAIKGWDGYLNESGVDEPAANTAGDVP